MAVASQLSGFLRPIYCIPSSLCVFHVFWSAHPWFTLVSSYAPQPPKNIGHKHRVSLLCEDVRRFHMDFTSLPEQCSTLPACSGNCTSATRIINVFFFFHPCLIGPRSSATSAAGVHADAAPKRNTLQSRPAGLRGPPNLLKDRNLNAH